MPAAIGALHARATTEDLMALANAIAIAHEDDPHAATHNAKPNAPYPSLPMRGA